VVTPHEGGRLADIADLFADIVADSWVNGSFSEGIVFN
jgi:hypothetical protein